MARLVEQWVIPDKKEFEYVINGLTQEALKHDALDAYAWADPKRGIISLYTHSRQDIEDFRALVRQFPAAEDGYQYETYLRDNLIQQYSLTVFLKDNLDNIQAEGLAPLIFKRNKYLKGSLRMIKVKSYLPEDVNAAGVSRKGWCLIHFVGSNTFLDSRRHLP